MEHAGAGVAPFELIDERPVDIARVLLEDGIEVSHRLVQVYAEDESDGRRRARAPRVRLGHAAGRVRTGMARVR